MTGTTGTAGYLYDARGRRVAKVTDGVTVTHYVYDTQYRVLEERDGDGDLLARYTLRLRSGQAYGTGMDEPLTMERGGNTYYYHHDGLGSITEVTDASGVLVERYEYDVYGAVTIFDGSGITLTTSAISNPYLFTARRYDPESGNYYYRARYYSPSLGRFLSQDPLGFEAGDYNLYRYAFNNPTNLTDPTGEFAFVTLLTQATAEAAADALMQAAFNWLFDPCVNTAEEALASIDCRRVGWAFLTGLVPGGRWIKSAVAAWGDIYFFLLDAEKLRMEVTPESVLRYFAWSFFSEIAGDYLGELVAKYGTRAIAKGLKKLGFDEWAERLLRQVDEVADDAGDVIDEAFPGGGSSRRLARNLIDSGVTRPPNTAAHHIVAGKGRPPAAQARAILAREGIDIDDAINGVFLPKNRDVPNPTGANVHSTLHTARYYQEVTRRLSNAAPGTVRDVLAQIRNDLLAGMFPH